MGICLKREAMYMLLRMLSVISSRPCLVITTLSSLITSSTSKFLELYHLVRWIFLCAFSKLSGVLAEVIRQAVALSGRFLSRHLLNNPVFGY